MIPVFRALQPQHRGYTFPTMDNMMLGFVHIAHELEHAFFVHIEQENDADNFLFVGIGR